MKNDIAIPSDISTKIEQWMKPPFDNTTHNEIQNLLDQDPQKLIDSFYTNLSFGTAGLRGIMGVGTNRINRYTIGTATQGLANYINKKASVEQKLVAIAYDSRHQSKLFAEESAKILAANGIGVMLAKTLRPTPFLSFICRYHGCIAGIMITASHNPPEYNGYKVYWSDGAQIVAPHDTNIIEEVSKVTSISSIKTTSLTHPLIQYLTEDDDKAYIEAFYPLQNYPLKNKKYGKDLKVVFSNLHGTGVTLLPQSLASWGFTNLDYVEEQKEPNGDFPTVKNPNPELKEALQLGLNLLSKTHGDLLIATDPDADRIGVAIIHNQKPILLNGNEIATICLYHLLETFKEQKRLSKQHAVVSTIVTTPLLKKMCDSYGVKFFATLTGFKYIGEKIREFEEGVEELDFLFGAEESYGFLYGTHTRDKDGIVTACLLCEIALNLKQENKTFIDLLYSIYKKFGVYQEKQLSITLQDGEQSQKLIESCMTKLRKDPPKTLENLLISSIQDYNNPSNTNAPYSLPKSNVLVYNFEDESIFIIRPSGTEPKIKIYGMMRQECSQDVEQTIKECETVLKSRLEKIKSVFLNL